MNNDITAFAPTVIDQGYRNQILGAFRAIADLTGTSFVPEEAFLLPEGIKSVFDVKEPINYSIFKSYGAFRTAIFEMLDRYMNEHSCVPKVFITIYNPTEHSDAKKNVDKMCQAVKEYYKEKNLGFVLTVVLTSRLHDYKYVDLINTPKHMLTFLSRIRMLQNQKLRKKVLVTIGTINNFSRTNANIKQKELIKKLKKLKSDPELEAAIEKFERFIHTNKKVVFCLGGRVEGSEIVFDINFAKKLYNDAQRLARLGYGIVFVNGPRTPNNVCDFLYEQAEKNQNIIFQNCKRIALSDDDRTPQRWRIYSGPYEEQFKKLEKLGNVYPGIIGFDNTMVVHTMDSFSSCETACSALPTAIACKGLFVDPEIRYDCHNLVQLLCPKYAIDFDEFVYFACNMGIEPNDLHPQILSNPIRVFAETVLNKINILEISDRKHR